MEKILKQVSDSTLEIVDGVEKIIQTTEQKLETTVAPVRKSAIKRFPTLFLLLVTFGVSTIFYGTEQLIIATPLLSSEPWFSVLIGILILVVIGQLYKKLA